MRILRKFSLLLLTLYLTSCSSMVDDFKKMTKGSKYTVEYYQEIVAEYDEYGEIQINGLTDEEGNLLRDEFGNPLLAYTKVESETLYAEPGKQTAAVAKDYAGFTKLPFEQKQVSEDGSTVVKIYYNRKLVTLTANIGEGIWNYAEKKIDPEIEDDVADKVLTRKYGSILRLDVMTSILASAGKKGCTLTKWAVQAEGSSNIVETATLPLSFPAQNMTYSAVWEEGKPATYSIVHYFEKVDCEDNTILSADNYQINDKYTTTKKGQPEYQTETQDCVRTVPGFTAREHSELEINASGATVVPIYYVRNSVDIKLNTDDGLWNYDLWKADKDNVTQNSAEKTISGKYETPVDYSAISSLKKTGMNLSGWKKADGDTVIPTDKLPKTFPVQNETYTAVWVKKAPVVYEVKHMTENLNSTDSENPGNYSEYSSDKTKKGVPEYNTEAKAIDISGFTAKDVEQKEIFEDGSTTVEVYYTRNEYSVSFDLNGGYWNYAEYKQNKESVTPDSRNKIITDKYETPIILPSFADMGKRSHDFTGWKDLATGITYTEESLVTSFQSIPAKDITLTAQWAKGDGVEYKVKHWFENVDSTNSSLNINYTVNDLLTQTELGEEDGDYTEASAKSVQGFTLREEPVQKPIALDGSTVIDIYYTRNTSNFIFDGNGGTVTGEDTITGKYEAVFDSENTPSATRDGWIFGGWTLNGKLITNEDLELENQSYGITDKTFKAYWYSMVSVGGANIFNDISLTVTKTETNVTCNVTLPVGYESEIWTYKWYVDGVYASDEAVFSRSVTALGRGVHTITVKASMNKQNFTKQATATID